MQNNKKQRQTLVVCLCLCIGILYGFVSVVCRNEDLTVEKIPQGHTDYIDQIEIDEQGYAGNHI